MQVSMYSYVPLCVCMGNFAPTSRVCVATRFLATRPLVVLSPSQGPNCCADVWLFALSVEDVACAISQDERVSCRSSEFDSTVVDSTVFPPATLSPDLPPSGSHGASARACTSFTATVVQPPGAAPKSATTMPVRTKRSNINWRTNVRTERNSRES